LNNQSSQNAHAIQTSPSLSTAYLQQQWLVNKCFTIEPQADSELVARDTASINRYLQDLGIDQAQAQNCVLVGQAINIDTLDKIVRQYFASAQVLVFRQHFLDGEFAQQAVEVSVYEHDKTEQGAKVCVDVSKRLVNNDVLKNLSTDYFIDAFRVSDISLSRPGLLVMDMDSTIINMECIDEIAALVGLGEKVAMLTERAMRGELDFNQSLIARVACLKGVDVGELEKLKSRLPINPGFAKTIGILQKHGWITCIASGGFTYFADYLKDTFDLNYAISNTLSVQGSQLTGKVQGDIVNGEMKRQILLQKLVDCDINPSQSIAIGDGSNDLLMMGAAALGVAYKAKPKVQAQADANIYYCGFEGLLYCLQN
jgi:phosphoserine phosphatase